jgi:WXG100 family type VII secretion target
MSGILVNYAALESANSQIQSIARSLDEKLDTLRTRLQQIQWEGADQEAYQAHQRQWDNALRDINGILNQIGSAVGTARENYMSTEASNAKVWG